MRTIPFLLTLVALGCDATTSKSDSSLFAKLATAENQEVQTEALTRIAVAAEQVVAAAEQTAENTKPRGRLGLSPGEAAGVYSSQKDSIDETWKRLPTGASRDEAVEAWLAEQEQPEAVPTLAGDPDVEIVTADWCAPCHQLLDVLIPGAEVPKGDGAEVIYRVERDGEEMFVRIVVDNDPPMPVPDITIHTAAGDRVIRKPWRTWQAVVEGIWKSLRDNGRVTVERAEMHRAFHTRETIQA